MTTEKVMTELEKVLATLDKDRMNLTASNDNFKVSVHVHVHLVEKPPCEKG